MKLHNITTLKSRTPEWLEARKQLVGASEAAAACGVSKWQSAYTLWAEKTGRYEREETEAMAMGTLLEDAVLKLYERRIGCDLNRDVGLLVHPAHPFIGATPDAIHPDGFPVEAKTTSRRGADAWGEEGTADIPLDYLLQVQQQMYVMDQQQADVVVWIDTSELRVYHVPRSDKLIGLMVEKIRLFWELVQSDTPPEIDYQHRDASKNIFWKYDKMHDERINLSGDMASVVRAYDETTQEIKRLTKKKDALRAMILDFMGNKTIAENDSHECRRNVTKRGVTLSVKQKG